MRIGYFVRFITIELNYKLSIDQLEWLIWKLVFNISQLNLIDNSFNFRQVCFVSDKITVILIIFFILERTNKHNHINNVIWYRWKAAHSSGKLTMNTKGNRDESVVKSSNRKYPILILLFLCLLPRRCLPHALSFVLTIFFGVPVAFILISTMNNR